MGTLAKTAPDGLLGLLQQETSRSLDDWEAWDPYRLSVQMGTDCCLFKTTNSEDFLNVGPSDPQWKKGSGPTLTPVGDPTVLGGMRGVPCSFTSYPVQENQGLGTG